LTESEPCYKNILLKKFFSKTLKIFTIFRFFFEKKLRKFFSLSKFFFTFLEKSQKIEIVQMLITPKIIIRNQNLDSIKYEKNAHLSESASRNIIAQISLKLWLFEKIFSKKIWKKKSTKIFFSHSPREKK